MKKDAKSRFGFALIDMEKGELIREFSEHEFRLIDFLKQYCTYLYALQKSCSGIDLKDFDSYGGFIGFMNSVGRMPTRIAELIGSVLEDYPWSPQELEEGIDDIEKMRRRLLFAKVRNGVFSGEFSTPSCISSLALDLLDIREHESVADFGCGEGSFLVQASLKRPEGTEYFGMDVYPEAAAIAMIRASLSDAPIGIELGNMFDDKYVYGRYDKVFSNYPLGVRPAHLRGDSNYLARVRQGLPEYGRPTSSDWIFNRLLFDAIKEDGKAIGVMSNGSTFNGMDRKIRRYFVDNGMIEGVVSLPANLLSHTSIPVSLVVLSHGNEGVRFVDARKEFEKGRRQNMLSEENISTIVDGFFHDTEISKFVANGEIAANDYVLSPARFIQEEIVIENGIPFGDLVVSSTRGATITAKELDKKTVKRETDCQYLMLADVVDGRISPDLPYLDFIDEKLEKYCIETGDLLLSKNGAPYKVAVAAVPEGKKILANGNLYVIKLDTDKVDPYYVAGFLQGETGRRLLARASVGATIPNLPLSNLKSIPIPLIPIEDQRRIVARFEAKLDQIEILKMQLEKARQEALVIFDEEL